MAVVEAYLANLYDLNTGRAGPEPLALPADAETVQALLEKLDLADGEHDMVFTEFHSDISGLAECLSQYDNLDELNYLVALLDEMSKEELAHFEAAVEHGEWTGDVENLINLAQNLDCYDLYQGITNAEDYGYMLIQETGGVPDFLQVYVDYEAYGRDVALNEGGEFSRAGYIYNNRSSFNIYYGGREDIPDEYRVLPPLDGPERPGEKEEIVLPDTNGKGLMGDANVQALIKALSEQGGQGPQLQALMLLVGQVSALEGHLKQAEAELATMRRELHGLRMDSKTQGAVTVLQGNILTVRDCVATVKQDIVQGCKNALAALKDKGVAALDGLMGFFHIKGGLTALCNTLEKDIQLQDKAIAEIENASKRYHEAGRHLSNAARAVVGREQVQEVKPVGKLARGLQAPYRSQRSGLARMKRSVEKALDAVERLEQAAERRPGQRSKQPPSINKTLETLNERIAQAPVKERAAPQKQQEAR